MGYHSKLSGEIAISPPIPWLDLQQSPFVPIRGQQEWKRLAWLRVEEEPVEKPEGTLIRKQAVAIRPSRGDELRADGLAGDVQDIVSAHGEGRTFTGFILVRGDESPDIWRVTVTDGKAVEVHPEIVWPDGTREPRP